MIEKRTTIKDKKHCCHNSAFPVNYYCWYLLIRKGLVISNNK